jgi:hypothetical protein
MRRFRENTRKQQDAIKSRSGAVQTTWGQQRSAKVKSMVCSASLGLGALCVTWSPSIPSFVWTVGLELHK